jgi:serine/threonine protein kinase/WD40 repeat protein
VEELFHQALALKPEQRAAFLEAACAGDAALRVAVEELLKHDPEQETGDGSLVSPVAREAERLRPHDPTLFGGVPERAAPARAGLPAIPGYELLEVLGRGGMGIVYKARQTSLNRIVALKMLLPFGRAGTEQLLRFRTEAEALARLHHPNIVAIYDIAEFEGRPYFTMEYVAGPNLVEVLHGRPQDAAASAQFVEVLARAIHAVHERGIIHRDLKPANILLESGGGDQDQGSGAITEVLTPDPRVLSLVPKITDFGLAKDQTTSRGLTQSGTVMGTPSYMAPEQAEIKEGGIGPAADIYALGSILYEMLTGRPPFDAGRPADTIVQVLGDEPVSPTRLRPGLPRDLVTICLKCLEKSPRRRYASALALAEDLRRFQAGEPIRARRVGFVERSYRWCRRRPLVAGLMALSSVLAVALIATLVVYDFHLREALKKETEDEAQQIREQQRQIIQLNITIGVTELEAGDTFTAVLRFTEALRLEDDPDRQRSHRTRIATALRQCPELTGLLTLDKTILCSDWNGAGGRVVTMREDHELEVRDVQTGQAIVSGLKHEEPPLAAALSPDGRYLEEVGRNGAVRIWDLRTGISRGLPSSSSVTYSAISENGRWLFTIDTSQKGQVWEAAKGKTTAAALNLAHGVHLAAVSADGHRLAVVGPGNALSVWDVGSAKLLGRSIRLPHDVSGIVFSPDGERIAIGESNRTVRLAKVQTGELLAEISRLDSAAAHLHFSPDGRLLLTGGAAGARVWDTATGHAVTPPLRHGGGLASAAFRDDGKQIVTVSTNGTVCFWKLPGAQEVTHAASSPAPSDRPIEELVALAQVLACGEIDAQQERHGFDSEHLRRAWNNLHSAP